MSEKDKNQYNKTIKEQHLSAKKIQEFWRRDRRVCKALVGDHGYTTYTFLMNADNPDYYSQMGVLMYGHVVARPIDKYPFFKEKNPFASPTATYHRTGSRFKLSEIIIEQWYPGSFDKEMFYMPIIKSEMLSMERVDSILSPIIKAYEIVKAPPGVKSSIFFIKISNNNNTDRFTISSLGLIAPTWLLATTAVDAGYDPNIRFLQEKLSKDDFKEYHSIREAAVELLNSMPSTIKSLKISKIFERLKYHGNENTKELMDYIVNLINELPIDTNADSADIIRRLSLFIHLATVFYKDDYLKLSGFMHGIVHESTLLVLKKMRESNQPYVTFEDQQSIEALYFNEKLHLKLDTEELSKVFCVPSHGGAHANLIAGCMASVICTGNLDWHNTEITVKQIYKEYYEYSIRSSRETSPGAKNKHSTIKEIIFIHYEIDSDDTTIKKYACSFKNNVYIAWKDISTSTFRLGLALNSLSEEETFELIDISPDRIDQFVKYLLSKSSFKYQIKEKVCAASLSDEHIWELQEYMTRYPSIDCATITRFSITDNTEYVRGLSLGLDLSHVITSEINKNTALKVIMVDTTAAASERFKLTEAASSLLKNSNVSLIIHASRQKNELLHTDQLQPGIVFGYCNSNEFRQALESMLALAREDFFNINTQMASLLHQNSPIFEIIRARHFTNQRIIKTVVTPFITEHAEIHPAVSSVDKSPFFIFYYPRYFCTKISEDIQSYFQRNENSWDTSSPDQYIILDMHDDIYWIKNKFCKKITTSTPLLNTLNKIITLGEKEIVEITDLQVCYQINRILLKNFNDTDNINRSMLALFVYKKFKYREGFGHQETTYTTYKSYDGPTLVRVCLGAEHEYIMRVITSAIALLMEPGRGNIFEDFVQLNKTINISDSGQLLQYFAYLSLIDDIIPFPDSLQYDDIKTIYDTSKKILEQYDSIVIHLGGCYQFKQDIRNHLKKITDIEPNLLIDKNKFFSVKFIEKEDNNNNDPTDTPLDESNNKLN